MLPQFHGCRQKTWDSWVRDKELSYSASSSRYQHFLVSLPQVPIPTGWREEGQGTCTHSRWHDRTGTLCVFGNSQLLQWTVSTFALPRLSANLLFALGRGRHYLHFQKLSTKQTFLKRVQNKGPWASVLLRKLSPQSRVLLLLMPWGSQQSSEQ